MKVGNITLPQEVLQVLDPAMIQQLQNPQMAQALEQAIGQLQPMYDDIGAQFKAGQITLDDLDYFNPSNHATPEDYARFGIQPPAQAQQQAQQAGNYVNPQTGAPEFAMRKDFFDKAKATAAAVAKLFTPQQRQQQQAPQQAPVQQVVQNQQANALPANAFQPQVAPAAPQNIQANLLTPQTMMNKINSAVSGQMMPNKATLNAPNQMVNTFNSSANPINLMAGGVGSKPFLKNLASSGMATPATNIMRGQMPEMRPKGSFGASEQEDTNSSARDTAEKMISSGMFKY